MYLTIKTIHITLVSLSFLLFFIRGMMMLVKNPAYRHKIFKVIPPVIDTFLLGTGVTLMILIQQYPTEQSWLAVKLIALIVYIVLGVIALNRGDSYKAQVLSFILAVVTILFMVTVARSHNPLGIFVFLS
jgi:uncharacterized membrane protein SirB2